MDHIKDVAEAAKAEEDPTDEPLPNRPLFRLQDRVSAFTAAQDEYNAFVADELKSLWLECVGLAVLGVLTTYCIYKIDKNLAILKKTVGELNAASID